jgi:hypothetical protein
MTQFKCNDTKWLGPRAYWYKNRHVRRMFQERHVNPTPNDSKWEECKLDYYDRDYQSKHIPPRVYNTLVDTSYQPSRTMFTRYGWVSSCRDYELFAETYPEEYAYELWFGHRGLARLSMDAHEECLFSTGDEYDIAGVVSNSNMDDMSDVYSDNETKDNEGNEDLIQFEMMNMVSSKDLDGDEFDTF